jgi:hypothetical protein
MGVAGGVAALGVAALGSAGISDGVAALGGAGISCSEERCRVPSRREAIWRKLASSSRARRAASWTLASINKPERDTRTRRVYTHPFEAGVSFVVNVN